MSGASSRVRPRVRQVDIVEFFKANRQPLALVSAERWKLEKGVFGYLRDAAEFIRDMRSEKKEDAKEDDKSDAVKKSTRTSIDQYYASQDLLKRMKWKRATWDEDADFDAFSRRVMDNDGVFSKVPPFSHMSLHIVRDKAARAAPPASPEDRQVNSIKPGTLTKWFLEERPYSATAPKPVYTPPPKVRQAPYSIDWEAGTVRVLDSASLQEMLVYLTTAAPRVQAVQERMEEEQTKIAEDIDSVRVRLGATAIKFNKYEKAFWDDPERVKDPANYVTPADVRLFIDNVNKSTYTLRKFVRNNQVRIVPAGHPYAIDAKELEIRVPANFTEYNFLPVHGRYAIVESFINAFRKYLMVWFFVGMVFVGDFELV